MRNHVFRLIFVAAIGPASASPVWAQAVKAEVKGEVKVDAQGAAAQGGAQADVTAPPAKPADTSDPTAGAQVAPRPAGEEAVARRYEDIVVVPRKAVLKDGRVELAPWAGLSVNDVLIRHYVFGGQFNYFLTDVLSVGLEGQYFIKERTSRESVVGLQYNRVATLNRHKYAGALNFGYAPGYGKFALFNQYIAHWEVVVTAGVGAIWTEIIPRVVGDEVFGGMRIAPNFGVGGRLFLSDWLTVNATLRDQVFNDKFEPTDRQRGQPIEQVQENATSAFVHNVTLNVSVGFFLPPSFQYKTAR
jgi:outer membrane beta-barrel protein